MALWINDSGASTAEIKSGVAAAQRYFDNIGWRPSLVWKMAQEDDPRATEFWQAAETAAFRAAFAGWQSQPEAASLVWEGE